MARRHKARPKGERQRLGGAPIRLAYPVKVEEDRPGYRAQFPDFPSGFTHGDSRKEALHRAQDLLKTMVSHYVGEGLELPTPSAGWGGVLIRVPVCRHQRPR